MDRHTPPSPAPAKSEPLPQGFQALVQHNSSAPPYSHEETTMEHPQTQSHPSSRYETPVQQTYHPPRTYDQAFQFQQRGGGGPHQGYHQSIYSQDHSPYAPIPEIPQSYSTPATSPPTPSRGSDIVSVRSSSAAHKGTTSKTLGPKGSRVEKSTATKKRKDRSKPAKNLPTLDKPMSELTRDSQIPVADIESYVSRSTEDRHAEIETGKNPGRVKRPMNAFMLYRKAYQQRAKEWASQHNHQVVSRVCGMSWPLEPETVREQFKHWADLERDNHQKAHPEYKFTPAKPQKQKYKEGKFDDSDGSDLEEFQWSAHHTRSSTKTPNYDPDADYIPPRSAYSSHPYQYTNSPLMGAATHHNRSTYDYSNPGKPMPSPYDQRDLGGQYYETQIHSHSRQGLSTVEDLMMRKTPSPNFTYNQQPRAAFSQYSPAQYHSQTPPPATDPARLPRFDHQHTQLQQLQQQHQLQMQQQLHQQQAQPARTFEHRIDPTLPLYDASNLNLFLDNPSVSSHQGWQPGAQQAVGEESESQFNDAYMGLNETLSAEQQVQFLEGAHDWQVEPLPDESQFDWADTGTKAEP